MTKEQDILDESEQLAGLIFRTVQHHLNGGSGEPVAIGPHEVSVVLHSLAKLSGYFLGRSPEDQADEFSDLVKHCQSHAAAELKSLDERVN